MTSKFPASIPLLLTCPILVLITAACSGPNLAPEELFSTAELPPKWTPTPTITPTHIVPLLESPTPTGPSLPSRTPTSTPTSTPFFQWPNEVGYGDVQSKLIYIDQILGSPNRILYRNTGLGNVTDYGADFSDRVTIDLMLVYGEFAPIIFVRDYARFTPSGQFRGQAGVCIEDSKVDRSQNLYLNDLWYTPSTLKQFGFMYRDLSEATGIDTDEIFSRLVMPGYCLYVPVELPHFVPSDDPSMSLADITKPVDDCELPCWNMMWPGKSSSSEIEPFFDRLGVSPEDIAYTADNYLDGSKAISYYESYPVRFPDIPPTVTLYLSKNVITAIEISDLHYEAMPISRVIEKIGNPSEIFIGVDFRVTVRYFTVFLRYPEHNLTILYSGEMMWVEDLGDEALCFKNDTGIFTTILFYSESKSIFDEISIISEWYEVDESNVEDFMNGIFHSVYDLTGMSIEEASKKLSEDDVCIPFTW